MNSVLISFQPFSLRWVGFALNSPKSCWHVTPEECGRIFFLAAEWGYVHPLGYVCWDHKEVLYLLSKDFSQIVI